MTVRDIEIAIARLFNYRMNIIVPNIRWGLFSTEMEADILVVRPSAWAIEIEIKISAADIKRDLKKRRHLYAKTWPDDFNLIQRKYFAVPLHLVENNHIPETAGIIGVNDQGFGKIIRPAKINKQARKLTDAEIHQVLRLGCMRIWTLKETLNRKVNHEQIL